MQPPLNTHRIDYIDNAKAIAMLLVVFGHAPGLPAVVMNFIYAFHMPVFFFISGLLLSKSKLALPFRDFVAAQFRSLGIPYLFFFVLSYLYWLPTHHLSASTLNHGPIAWWEPLLGLFEGSQQAWAVNAVLWFFVCLFMAAAIYFFARRVCSEKCLALVSSVLAIGFSLIYVDVWPRWPWRLDSTLIALSFYAVGHWANAHLAQLAKLSRLHIFLLVAVLWFVVLIGTIFNGKVDLNFLQFGSVPLAYFVNAYLGILALLFVSQLLPPKRILNWIAKNTIIIFPTHLLLYSLFTGVGVVLLAWPHDFKESSWVWVLVFPLLALVLIYPWSLILERCCPFLWGKRKPSTNIFSHGSSQNA